MNPIAELSDQSLFSFQDAPGVDGPIVMVNLLRFHDQADYLNAPSDESQCSGQQAYSIYAKAVVPLILEVGGFPVWAGNVRSSLIGVDGEAWDKVALIAYPSRKAFVDMHVTQAYVDCVKHRNAGLADVRLIETRPIFFPQAVVRFIGLFFRLKAFFLPRSVVKKIKIST